MIRQTDNSGSFKKASFNTFQQTGFPYIFEAEMQFPTTGQGAGAFIYGALIIGNGAVILDRANNVVRFQNWSVADVVESPTVAFTVALDTWYKLRVVSSGPRYSAFVDGTLKGTRDFLNANNVKIDQLFLGSFGSIVHFRNLKGWALRGSAPA